MLRSVKFRLFAAFGCCRTSKFTDPEAGRRAVSAKNILYGDGAENAMKL
jgi:hypothetical protein